jgi:hypothetical protein
MTEATGAEERTLDTLSPLISTPALPLSCDPAPLAPARFETCITVTGVCTFVGMCAHECDVLCKLKSRLHMLR